MNYQEFKNDLKLMLAEKFGDSVEVREYQAYRTNAGKVDMLGMFGRGEEGDACVPSLCVQEFYGQYQRGAVLEEVVASAVEECRKRAEAIGLSVLPGELADYRKVRDRVYFRVISRERNGEMLSDVPHVDFLDLSIAFYVLVVMGDDGTGSILISGKLMEHWGLSEEELHRQAKENTPGLLPVKVRSLLDALQERIIHGGGDNALEEMMGAWEENAGKSPIMLTNDLGVNGFSAVFYPDVLRGIAERLDSDLLVLPCSIHEALLIPCEEEMDVWGLKEIVKAVNRSTVPPWDFLSDEVYLFERKEDRLRFAEQSCF